MEFLSIILKNRHRNVKSIQRNSDVSQAAITPLSFVRFKDALWLSPGSLGNIDLNDWLPWLKRDGYWIFHIIIRDAGSVHNMHTNCQIYISTRFTISVYKYCLNKYFHTHIHTVTQQRVSIKFDLWPCPLKMKLLFPLCHVICSKPIRVVSTRRHWPLFQTL